MGDKGSEVDEFGLLNKLLPDDLLDELLVPLNKQENNMLKDKLNSSIPRTPGPTGLLTGSLSYPNMVNNGIFVPPLPPCPYVPEKPWAMANPNQSALNALNPVVGRGRALAPSPPIAPIGRRTTGYNQVKNWDSQWQIRNFGPLRPPNPLPNPMTGIMWGPQRVGGQFGTGVYDATPRMPWGGPQFPNQWWSMGSVPMGPMPWGSGLQTDCVGTGVFFPRLFYNTIPVPEPRKKTGGSTAQPPPRAVQAQNKSKNKKSRNVQSQRRFGRGGQNSANGSEHAMARRNAAVAPEQKKSEPVKKTSNAAGASAQGTRVHGEIRLPHDWTY